jgi:hypothetical protein
MGNIIKSSIVTRLTLLIAFYFAGNSLLSQNTSKWIVNDHKTGEFKFVYRQDTTWLYNYDSLKKLIVKEEPISITNADQIPQRYSLKKNGDIFIMKIFNYKNEKFIIDTFAIIGSLERRYFPELTTVIYKTDNISYDSRVEYDSILSISRHYVFNAYSSGHNFGESFCKRYFFSKKGLYLDRIEYFKRKSLNGLWTNGLSPTLAKKTYGE